MWPWQAHAHEVDFCIRTSDYFNYWPTYALGTLNGLQDVAGRAYDRAAAVLVLELELQA